MVKHCAYVCTHMRMCVCVCEREGRERLTLINVV